LRKHRPRQTAPSYQTSPRRSNGQRERDRWLSYIAALIKAPQEVWRLKLSASEELYLLGRFLRGKQAVEALAVFKRDGQLGDWPEAKTAYIADADDYLNEKRRQLMKQRAAVRYLDVAGL
jgi:hypothetical protein